MNNARHPQKVTRSPRRTGGFLLEADGRTMRDPHTVKQWTVQWIWKGREYVLKSHFNLCADLARAFRAAENDFFWIEARGFPQAAYWRQPLKGALHSVELVPCTSARNMDVYKKANDFLMSLKSHEVWRFWDNFLDEYGEELPDVFELGRLLNEK